MDMLDTNNRLLEIILEQQKTINALLSAQNQSSNSVCTQEQQDSSKKLTTFENQSKEFEKELLKKGLSKNTVDSYVFTTNRFYEDFSELSLENLSIWEKDLKAKKSPKTVNLRIIAMEKYLKFVGFSGFEFTKLKEQKKAYCDNAINEEQYLRLIEWAKDHSIQTYKIVKIISLTGVRVSELISLKTEDLEKGYADIVSKANKARRIYFPKGLVEDIGKFCDKEFLITNRLTGKPLTTRGVSQNLLYAAEKANIPKEVMHPHSFRHFFAKQFLKTNNDITLLGDLLGHSNISTTAIYTRMTSKEQQTAINSIVTW